MYVICECLDNPNAARERAASVGAHRAYLKSNLGTLRLAGPMLNTEGTSVGSVLVLDVDSIGAARAFVAGDPFTAAGVFADVTYKAFNPTINGFAA